MANLVEFEDGILRIKTTNSKLALDWVGILEVEVANYRTEEEQVRGLGDKMLLFIDRLLEQGYKVLKTVADFHTARVDLKIGNFVVSVILKQGLGKNILYLDFENRAGKISSFIESKYVFFEYKNTEFGFVKRYYEEDNYWAEVKSLLEKYKIAVVYGSLMHDVVDDKLYLTTQEGVKVLELTPTQWRLFFIACSGWSLGTAVYYRWLLNVINKHYNKFEIKKISDGYEVKYGNLTIWYRDKGFEAEYQDGIRIEFKWNKIVGQYETRLYFEEETDSKTAWKYISEIKKALRRIIKTFEYKSFR